VHGRQCHRPKFSFTRDSNSFAAFMIASTVNFVMSLRTMAGGRIAVTVDRASDAD